MRLCWLTFSVAWLVVAGGARGLCGFFAGMKVYVSLGMTCVSPEVSQNRFWAGSMISHSFLRVWLGGLRP